jgi:hypothetical protein
MVAEFLGITSKITFHENPLVGIGVTFSEKIMDEQTYSHIFASIPFLQIVVRR